MSTRQETTESTENAAGCHARDEYHDPQHAALANLCTKLERERDAAIKLLDDLDEIMHTMKPRYFGHPSMDGRYPCWIVWLPEDGTCERKTLKDAVIEFAAQTLILPPNAELSDRHE